MALAPVDLVVLDLSMSDVHGLEVQRLVRSHERFCALPVVNPTTRGHDDSRDAAPREGATRYLTTPFQPTTCGSATTRRRPVGIASRAFTTSHRPGRQPEQAREPVVATV